MSNTNTDKENKEIFSYFWHLDPEETDRTNIRCYGLNNKNQSVLLKISNFEPYCYIELPELIKWNEGNSSLVVKKIHSILEYETRNQGSEYRPLKNILVKKHKLYYARIDEKGNRALFPYILCTFVSKEPIMFLANKLKYPLDVPGIGKIQLKVHENASNPILQLIAQRKLPTAGWISFDGKKVVGDKKESSCDLEYNVKWKNLSPIEKPGIGIPLVMSFDIEVNSSLSPAMPNPELPDDCVFQISCIFQKGNNGKEEVYLLSLGDPDKKFILSDNEEKEKDKNVNILKYECEYKLLIGFTQLVNEKSPNVIIGYNILGFDIDYMIKRSKLIRCIREFCTIGFMNGVVCKDEEINWSSSAYKNQSFTYVNAEGRLFVDLLPLIRRDYKFHNYKLSTIATSFLGKTKDPLTPQGIFKCYRIGMKGGEQGRKALGIVGKYCIQDTKLVLDLFNKLNTWIGLCEMATTCCVPIFAIYTQGQQVKVFSQVYVKCTHDNIVVESNGYITKADERYTGAMVFPPIPGLYEKVVPFDFSSLYPTTIIAYNIDYSTLVRECDRHIPDSDCHIIEWEDHQKCEHDPHTIRLNELNKIIKVYDDKLKEIRGRRNTKNRDSINQEIENVKSQVDEYVVERRELKKTQASFLICKKWRYKFLKKPIGVLPEILTHLLEARDKTKKEMKGFVKELANCKNEEERNIIETNILTRDKRQLSYKISANSVYGALGVRQGALPFMPGAMCTTAMGRKSISLVAKVIPEKFGGVLVYGDTDSSYVSFPEFNNKSAKDIWEHAEMVAVEVSKLFPKPMKLAFEEVIYWMFLILSKKRYMSLSCDKDGKIKEGISKKGVILARRDNPEFIRDLYQNVVIKIFERIDMISLLGYIVEQFNLVCSKCVSYKKFIATSSIGSTGDFLNDVEAFDSEIGNKIQIITEGVGKGKVQIGNYKVKPLSKNEDEIIKEIKKKKLETKEEYYMSCLPPAVQLAEKMKKRGQPVDKGSRLEYVILTQGGRKAKKSEKMEDYDYFIRHNDILKLDYLWYIEKCSNPIDQLLNVVYSGEKNFTADFVYKQYLLRVKKDEMLKELISYVEPKIIIKK